MGSATAPSAVAAPTAVLVPAPVTASTAVAAPDERLFRDGDLIFRSGTGLDSWLIEFLDGRFAYSHVGLVDFRDGFAQVVHIEPGNETARGDVRREALAEFLSAAKAEGFAVYRVASATPRRVAEALGVVQGFESAGVTFDHRLDLESADEMYCSELVWRAYLAAGIDLSATESERFRFPLGRRPVVKLSDLAHAPDMELVTSFTPSHRGRSQRITRPEGPRRLSR